MNINYIILLKGEIKVMREFNVSSYLQPYVETILERRNIVFQSKKNKIQLNLSGTKFHRIVNRAKCEALMHGKHPDSGIMYIMPYENMDEIARETGYTAFYPYPIKSEENICWGLKVPQ